jgi:hypothetical protein
MSLPLEIIAGLRDLLIVGALGFGLKLMKQQNELLEREKALKQSEIDVHKANIEHLKALQAPAIAKELEQMISTSEHLARRKQEVDEKLMALTDENEALDKMADLSYLSGISAGCLEAIGILQNSTESAGAWAGLSARSLDEFLLERLQESMRRIGQIANQALSGTRPELKEFKKWMDRVKATA